MVQLKKLQNQITDVLEARRKPKIVSFLRPIKVK